MALSLKDLVHSRSLWGLNIIHSDDKFSRQMEVQGHAHRGTAGPVCLGTVSKVGGQSLCRAGSFAQ